MGKEDNKQAAIAEFEEFCVGLVSNDDLPIGDSVGGVLDRMKHLQTNLQRQQDAIPLINEKAKELLEKYSLDQQSVWNEFQEIVQKTVRASLGIL